MEKEIIQSLDHGERVSSSYAENYFDDEYCDYKKPPAENKINSSKKLGSTEPNVWVSPSDLLIGKLDLTPPFTSKLARGIAHKGILAQGDEVIEKERAKFLKYLTELLADNDSAWLHIQEQEKIIVAQKVKAIYERIFQRKSKTMQKEMDMFYEDTLREMENHLRREVQTVLMSTHCSIISDLNKEIKEKLSKERQKLENVLRKKYDKEVRKLNKYYNLLYHNESHRSNRLLNNAIYERNDALKSFIKQIENENITSTMYVMCTERKKCKMRQFLLQNFHTREIEEKIKTIKEKQKILDDFNKNKRDILDINKEWEDNVKKILHLFLKFISFSLKLLPEQTIFLLDLEKLVVLQLNEIEKNPTETPSILINNDDFVNMFEFKEPELSEDVCKGEPFVIEGDLSPSIPTPYGSRETLPSHVELPFFRLQRQFIYAKCQKIEQVRAYLESLRCKCHDPQRYISEPSVESSMLSEEQTPPKPPSSVVEEESSHELFMVEDIKRLKECPLRGCHNLTNRMSFPNLDEYLEFDEEKFARVQAILGKPEKFIPPPPLIDPKEILAQELLFAETKEKHRNAATQCSSIEELLPALSCDCVASSSKPVVTESAENIDIDAILLKRKQSLNRIIHENPKLLKLFTEENFDFVY